MFGISIEHILVMGVVLLIFGPRRLPELGNSIGKAIRGFREGVATPPEVPKTIEAEAKPEPIKAASPHDGHVG